MVEQFSFGTALQTMKIGQKVTREGWDGKNTYVSYHKGYKVARGDELIVINPYFIIKASNGTFNTWSPTVEDVLAEDWYVVNTNVLF